MKTVLFAVICFAATLALPQPRYVPVCDKNKCKLPLCQCSKSYTPPLSGNIPQVKFIILFVPHVFIKVNLFISVRSSVN